jgi:hypothetical protein
MIVAADGTDNVTTLTLSGPTWNGLVASEMPSVSSSGWNTPTW